MNADYSQFHLRNKISYHTWLLSSVLGDLGPYMICSSFFDMVPLAHLYSHQSLTPATKNHLPMNLSKDYSVLLEYWWRAVLLHKPTNVYIQFYLLKITLACDISLSIYFTCCASTIFWNQTYPKFWGLLSKNANLLYLNIN